MSKEFVDISLHYSTRLSSNILEMLSYEGCVRKEGKVIPIDLPEVPLSPNPRLIRHCA